MVLSCVEQFQSTNSRIDKGALVHMRTGKSRLSSSSRVLVFRHFGGDPRAVGLNQEVTPRDWLSRVEQMTLYEVNQTDVVHTVRGAHRSGVDLRPQHGFP